VAVEGAVAPHPLNFRMSGKTFLVRKFSQRKYKIWAWKSPILGEFVGAIDILSSHIFFLRRKFAAVCWKIATFCLPTF